MLLKYQPTIQTLPPGNNGNFNLERYEAKYLIHRDLVPAIREFIKPFCRPDPNASGDPPEYIVSTLQLDTPDLALCRAAFREAINRFKLRLRTYGLGGEYPVFLEIKRKIKNVVAKSRVCLPFDNGNGEQCLNGNGSFPFLNAQQEHNYLEFVRLARELRARPRVLIRYHRESYLGANDHYARVTLDRRLCYHVTSAWNLLPAKGNWWSIDSTDGQAPPFSGVVMELKTFGDAPVWMVDLTERFNLVRVGFSKYVNAMLTESRFAAFAESRL